MATLDSDDLTAIDNLLAARGLPAVTLVKTSDNAASIINAAAAGSLIVLAPGTHTLSAAIELENDDVTIQGFGNATVVSSTVDGVPIRTFADNLTLRDFKLYSRSGGLDSPGQGIGYNTTTFPSGVTGCKNLRIKNITIDCLKDGIMFFPANSDANAIIEDCHILSTDSADAAVDIHLTANAVVSLRDCVIEASNDIGLLNEGAGTIEMLGGRVITPGSSQFSIVQSLTSTMIVSDETIYDAAKATGTLTTIKRDLTANAISAVSSAASTETASSISSIAAARVVIPTNALSIPPVRTEVSRLRVLRRSSFTHTLENVGDLAGVSKIVFTIKDNKEIDNDAASLAQVVLSIPAASSTDGIKYLGGSAAGAKRTSGSIAVQSYTEGSESRKRIVVAIADDATASIPVESNGTFDIKLIMASDSEIVDSGKAVVEEVTTWETSS